MHYLRHCVDGGVRLSKLITHNYHASAARGACVLWPFCFYVSNRILLILIIYDQIIWHFMLLTIKTFRI